MDSKVDLLVRHGYLITMDKADRVFRDGAIAIAGRRIMEVGEDADIAGRYKARRMLDAGGAPVHPGLLECHLHASTLTLRGTLADQIKEDDLFDSFDCPYYNTVTEEEEYLGVLLAAIEMIRNGTTCFMEAGTVLEPMAAVRATREVGIRALLGDAFLWDRPEGFVQGLQTPELRGGHLPQRITRAPKNREEALARMGGVLKLNRDPEALVTGHIAVLGLGTASDEFLLEAKRQADAAGTVVNMHQSYSPVGRGGRPSPLRQGSAGPPGGDRLSAAERHDGPHQPPDRCGVRGPAGAGPEPGQGPRRLHALGPRGVHPRAARRALAPRGQRLPGLGLRELVERLRHL
jgi:cytosine/adenosine deaminase-related metal-dependent hydrolase